MIKFNTTMISAKLAGILEVLWSILVYHNLGLKHFLVNCLISVIPLPVVGLHSCF